MQQFHNKIRSLWWGGWWWSPKILRATKFGKQIFVSLSENKGRERLIIWGPLNAHCVFVFSGVSFVGLVGAVGCTCQISKKPIYTMNHCQIFSCTIFYKSQDLSNHWAYKGFRILLSDWSLWRWIFLICQTLSMESHERKIRTIWPHKLLGYIKFLLD